MMDIERDGKLVKPPRDALASQKLDRLFTDELAAFERVNAVTATTNVLFVPVEPGRVSPATNSTTWLLSQERMRLKSKSFEPMPDII